MNRGELIRKVTEELKTREIRKPISTVKHVFHISDDDGNTSDFVVRKSSNGLLFTIEDVEAVLTACMDVIKDAIRHGDHVSVRGFGTLSLMLRQKHFVKHPGTGERVEVKAHYIPKFSCGNELRRCARLYDAEVEDREASYAENYQGFSGTEMD